MHAGMTVNGLTIGVHRPRKDPRRGRVLAARAPQGVHNIADYKDMPQGWPRAQGPNELSCFVGVTDEHEMWFDVRPLNQHSHYAAVVVIVQRVNALTARTADHVYLEKYVDTCPKHETLFEAERFCPECKFKWPAQNYITNAGGADSERQFWLDGWRSQDGEIRQFVFADVEKGLGVAQQLIGEERTADIRFAIFLSKEPKPVPPRLQAARRGGGDIVDCYLGDNTKGGGFLGHALNSPVFGAKVDSSSQTRSLNMMATLGASSLGDEDASFLQGNDPRTIGAPVKQEVSFGRAVDQKIHPDPHDIGFWQDEPAAVIMLTPAPAAWVETVTRNGATVDRTLGGMGPLAGLKGVG
ncbi:MAG: hypothetical protein NTX72_01310 [Candidatus Uhrbacteria bacterium]|nr:hypothetical protein [Candidatus Uhrbacteria bacterium]